MVFPKSATVLTILLAAVIAMAAFLLVYLQGGISHAVPQ